jgi:hypothetical protein
MGDAPTLARAASGRRRTRIDMGLRNRLRRRGSSRIRMRCCHTLDFVASKSGRRPQTNDINDAGGSAKPTPSTQKSVQRYRTNQQDGETIHRWLITVGRIVPEARWPARNRETTIPKASRASFHYTETNAVKPSEQCLSKRRSPRGLAVGPCVHRSTTEHETALPLARCFISYVENTVGSRL